MTTEYRCKLVKIEDIETKKFVLKYRMFKLSRLKILGVELPLALIHNLFSQITNAYPFNGQTFKKNYIGKHRRC